MLGDLKRIAGFIIVLCLNNLLYGMLPTHFNLCVRKGQSINDLYMLRFHSHFEQLPIGLQQVCKQHPNIMDRVGVECILQGLAEKKRPESLDIVVWRMVMNLSISHQTADHMLMNLNRLFTGKPMINDALIDWNKEKNYKVNLIQPINCKAVRDYCISNLNDEHSLLLQEFVYGRLNPQTSLVFEGPYISPDLVTYAATHAGCHNPKAFDIKHPGFEYHEVENHRFCSE